MVRKQEMRILRQIFYGIFATLILLLLEVITITFGIGAVLCASAVSGWQALWSVWNPKNWD